MTTRFTAVALAVGLAACGGSSPAPARPIAERSDADAPREPDPPPLGVSTAPLCARPDEVIGVCQISESGVTLQARDLKPGANALFQLDGDYSATPFGCRQRWYQEQLVDAGGVATARFDIPTTDKCALFASMTARVYVEPDGPDLGPRRFSTMPPPGTAPPPPPPPTPPKRHRKRP